MSDEIKINDNSEQNNPQEEIKATYTNLNDDFDYLLGTDNGFSFEETELTEVENANAKRKANPKAKRRKKAAVRSAKTVIWFITILVVSVVLAFSIILFASEYLGIGFNKGKECTVEISKGMSTSQIATELKDQNAISSALMFRIYSRLAGFDGSYEYGVYTFTNELGYEDLAKMLQTEGAKASSVKVTIPEQANIDDIMNLLEKNGVCTKSDFRNAVRNGKYDFDFVEEIPTHEVYYKFEGYLFPDTYQFYNYDSKECAELAIRKMLQNTANRLTDEVRAKIKQSGYSIHDILTMASIIELEASAKHDEMPKVSAVFYNRLNWDEPKLLGSSPTIDYPYGNGRYNTNVHEGLPPGPLCSPSEDAILAAVSPADNFSATYFVTDSEMKFYYNNSLTAHQQTIAKLKQQGKWLG